MSRTNFERNLRLQPLRILQVLDAHGPALPLPPPGGRLMLVGTGSNHHVAQIARWLWRKHGGRPVEAWTSLDFLRFPAKPSPRDIVAVLSHRGTKKFSAQALRLAQRAGSTMLLFTAHGSPVPPGVLGVRTCESEVTGAYTKSVTTTLAWLVRWIGSPALNRALRRESARINEGPKLPSVRADSDLVLVGDCMRGWIARETALKLFETAHLPARPFGLEEFLHGPRLSAGPRTQVIGFCSAEEPRWRDLWKFLRTVGVPYTSVLPGAGLAGWLTQIYWGQRLALSAALKLGRDPDALRKDEPRWLRAREALEL